LAVSNDLVRELRSDLLAVKETVVGFNRLVKQLDAGGTARWPGKQSIVGQTSLLHLVSHFSFV
jgi:hypothetical protein